MTNILLILEVAIKNKIMKKSRKYKEALEYHSQGKAGKIGVYPTRPYSMPRDLA